MTITTPQPVNQGAGFPTANAGATNLTVNRVVATAVLLGTTAVILALVFGGTDARSFDVTWLDGYWLHLALLALTCLCVAEAVGVRLMHDDEGDTVEELNLLEAVVLLSALVLPVRHALLITLAGSLVPYLFRRLKAVKVLYNLGVYASASTATTLLVAVTMPDEGRLDARLVLAMSLGATVFVLVNLLHMAFLLSAIGDTTPATVLREDARLSLLTIIGTVGLTGTVLVMATAAPVLVPCAVLPAIALRFAYAASAARQDERRRSARVLAFSQMLASGPKRDIAIEAFLRMIRQEFGARASMLLSDREHGLIVDSSEAAARDFAVTDDLQALTVHPELHVVETPGALREWSRVMAAPVIVDGERIGTAVVARQGKRRFHGRDVIAFRSILAALVVALQSAEHMSNLLEETSKLRAVVEQAGDGIVVLGRNGGVQIWSPAMTRITGVSAETAIGTRLADAVQVVNSTTQGIDPFAEGEPRPTPEMPRQSMDIELVRSDGERRATRFSHAATFEDGALVRDVIIVRDLTAERQVDRMKGDFIATVSHELRTPLTPIKGYATMLRKHGDGMPLEKRQRALDVIVDRTEHLGRLIEDLLAASTVTADREPQHALSTGDADLVALVARTCEDFPSAGERLTTSSTSGDVRVIGDPTRVVQIISNLVGNALKYSPTDRPVHISVERLEEKGRVIVVDQGAGIPSSQTERIFHKFYRVEDPMVMSTGGTGLGLFIARQLARAMGGDIAVQSTLDVGSTFSLTLPLHVERH